MEILNCYKTLLCLKKNVCNLFLFRFITWETIVKSIQNKITIIIFQQSTEICPELASRYLHYCFSSLFLNYVLIRWLDYEFFFLAFHYSCKSKTYFTVSSKVMKIKFVFCRILLLLRYHIKFGSTPGVMYSHLSNILHKIMCCVNSMKC